jgi:cell division protein FtsL
MSSAKARARRSRFFETIAALGLLAACFAMLLVRLEVLREGYELSTVKNELGNLKQRNHALKLEIAKLSSRERLRALATKYGMTAPVPAQTVVVP